MFSPKTLKSIGNSKKIQNSIGNSNVFSVFWISGGQARPGPGWPRPARPARLGQAGPAPLPPWNPQKGGPRTTKLSPEVAFWRLWQGSPPRESQESSRKAAPDQHSYYQKWSSRGSGKGLPHESPRDLQKGRPRTTNLST